MADLEVSAPKEKAVDPEASAPMEETTDPVLQLAQTSTGVFRAQEDKAAAPLVLPEASRGHVSILSFELSSFCQVRVQRSRWE